MGRIGVNGPSCLDMSMLKAPCVKLTFLPDLDTNLVEILSM
jgi:hypothetical protein